MGKILILVRLAVLGSMGYALYKRFGPQAAAPVKPTLPEKRTVPTKETLPARAEHSESDPRVVPPTIIEPMGVAAADDVVAESTIEPPTERDGD